MLSNLVRSLGDTQYQTCTKSLRDAQAMGLQYTLGKSHTHAMSMGSKNCLQFLSISPYEHNFALSLHETSSAHVKKENVRLTFGSPKCR